MSKPTILCVDDERNVLLTLRAQLLRHFPDYAIEIAESASEALEVAGELIGAGGELPLVIADQIMPGMKGDEFLIQFHTLFPQSLKVMLTGQARAEDVGNVVNRGNLYRFIAKPWNEDDLVLTVSEALRRYQQERQLERQQAALEQANRNLEALNADLERQVQERTEQLRQSEEQFRLLSEISPVGIFRTDPQGAYTYANRKTLEMIGVPLEHHLGAEWSTYLHPENRESMIAAWSHYVEKINQGQTVEYSVEQRFLHPDQTLRWALAQAIPNYDRSGNLIGFIGSIVDITERKRAELALQDNQIKLTNAQRIARLGNWEFDLITQKILWSEEMFRIFDRDLSQGEPTYAEFQQMIHPEDWDLLETGIQQLVATGIPYELEHRILLSDGTIRYLMGKGELSVNAQGQPVRIFGTGQDITTTKQAELALRESEEQNRAILSAVPDIMSIIDANGCYLTVSYNQFDGELIPLAGSDSAGLLVTEVLPPEIAEKCLTAIQQALHTGKMQTFEQQLRFGDRIQYEDVRIVPYQADKVLCMVRNVSDRKRAEDQIRASLREKEALLAEIHHRVKNNLQIISSLLNLQAYKIDDPNVHKALEDSWTRIDSMALVHETLYHSQNFSNINFADYLKNLTQNLFHTYNIQSEQIRLTIAADQGIALSLNQAVPCGLIVNELVTNALKHGFKSLADHRTDAELSVYLTQTEQAHIQLSVSNSGDTLPPDFNPRKTHSMGLQLVNTLVQQLEGELDVERGDRTKFQITFNPLLESQYQ